jgi:hypothetical protein
VAVLLAVLSAVVAVYGLHLLALWAEDRGWMYYRRRKPTSSGLGNAFLEVQSLIEPEKRQLVNVQRTVDVEEDDQGDSPGVEAG